MDGDEFITIMLVAGTSLPVVGDTNNNDATIAGTGTGTDDYDDDDFNDGDGTDDDSVGAGGGHAIHGYSPYGSWLKSMKCLSTFSTTIFFFLFFSGIIIIPS